MSYVKTEWATGDVITAQKLNNMEDGIEAVDEYAEIFTADVSESVGNWLDDHPEATTTVEDNAITTPKLQDGAVTTPKLANGSVTDDKLASDGIKAEVSDLKTDLSKVMGEGTLNFAYGATWEQGAWIQGTNWDSGSLNGTTTRIGTTIDLGERNITNVQLYVNDNNYSFEYYAFDNQHNSVGYNGTWQTNLNLNFPKGVRYIRVDMRKNDNSAVTSAISKYFVANINGASNAKTALLNKSNNIKLNILTNNVGAFNYGNSGGYSGDDAQTKVTEWKQMINHYGADIMFIQENAVYFDSAHNIVADSVLYEPIYPYYIYEGNQALYIASKLPIFNPETIDISATINEVTYTRYARKGEITIDNNTIAIVDAHLSPGSGSDDESARLAQFTKLVDSLAGYSLVIIAGDFNTSDSAFIALAKSKGYLPVNCDYLGAIETMNGESPDNVLLKGFIPCHTEAKSENACTSDHYPLNTIIRLKA